MNEQNSTLKDFDFSIAELKDDMLTSGNYLQKYFPLIVQSMVTDTLRGVFGRN